MGMKKRSTPKKLTDYFVLITCTNNMADISYRTVIVGVDEAEDEDDAIKLAIEDAIEDYPGSEWQWRSTSFSYEDN